MAFKHFSYAIPFMFLLFCATNSYGNWAKTYGGTDDDLAHSVQQTSDNGYIVAGSTQSFGDGSDDVWVLKLDSSGTVQWQKTYGGIYSDFPNSIQQTSDDGYIVAGTTRSFGAGINDFWVLKLESSGNMQWQKTYGGTDYDHASSVQQTNDDGYIVAGTTFSFGAGLNDIWVLKLDSSGNIQWEKTYGTTGEDATISIQQTSDGGYIVPGYTSSEQFSESDIWILKLDSSGTVQWQKTYDGIRTEYPYSVQQTTDNGYIVAGQTLSFGADVWDMLVLKLDSSGAIQWQKAYGGTASDGARSVQQTDDGGYIVAGVFNGYPTDSWVLKLDSGGTVQWQKTTVMGSSDEVQSVQQTSDGGYVVAGDIFAGPGDHDFWLLKLNSSGDIPECPIAGTSDALVTETTLTDDNTIFTTSNSSATISDTSVSPQDTSCTIITFCEDATDTDEDGILDSVDNCPQTPNGPSLGLCYTWSAMIACTTDTDCGGLPGSCTMNQEDSYPPQGNNIGDACDCEGNFDCDQDVDGTDAATFKADFGRSQFGDPCEAVNQCHGDFDCDQDCDGTDASIFKQDFGRSTFNYFCPACEVGEWCVYDIGVCEEDCQTELDLCLVGCEEWPPDSRYICNDNCVFDYHYNCIPACENG